MMISLLVKALSPIVVKFLEDEVSKIPNVDQQLLDNVITAVVALADSLVN